MKGVEHTENIMGKNKSSKINKKVIKKSVAVGGSKQRKMTTMDNNNNKELLLHGKDRWRPLSPMNKTSHKQYSAVTRIRVTVTSLIAL